MNFEAALETSFMVFLVPKISHLTFVPSATKTFHLRFSPTGSLNRLAVATSFESVYLKRVTKSKRRRVYSSGTRYMRLLKYKINL